MRLVEGCQQTVIENPTRVFEYQISMKLPDQFHRRFQAPPLTRLRIILALTIAVVADGLQLLLGFLGWVGADQVIDVAAMVLTGWVIGFHWLLLPTFVLEFIPVVDALPTWTACVIAVIVLRQHRQPVPPKVPAQLPATDIITSAADSSLSPREERAGRESERGASD
jgi:hypothetical protein